MCAGAHICVCCCVLLGFFSPCFPLSEARAQHLCHLVYSVRESVSACLFVCVFVFVCLLLWFVLLLILSFHYLQLARSTYAISCLVCVRVCVSVYVCVCVSVVVVRFLAHLIFPLPAARAQHLCHLCFHRGHARNADHTGGRGAS